MIIFFCKLIKTSWSIKKKEVPCSIAYARVVIDSIYATAPVFARIRQAFVNVGLTIFPCPSWQAFAFVLVISECQTNAVIFARTFLAESYTQLRLTRCTCVSGLTVACIVTLFVFDTDSTVSARTIQAWWTWGIVLDIILQRIPEEW